MALLRARGHEVALEWTRGRGHAGELAAAAAAEGADRILVAGGDGTVGEAAGALAGGTVPLGILPVGRGNDLAGALGVPTDPETAALALATGLERRMDLGFANGRAFGSVVGVGFDAHVGRRVRGRLWGLAGRMGYAAGAAVSLPGYRPRAMRISGDFGVREGRFLLVAVANGYRYGGGIRIAPDADLWDGQLDGCLVGPMAPGTMLRILPAAFRGGHRRFGEVELLRGSAWTIETEEPMPVIIDGEVDQTTPLTVTVRRAALPVVVPAPVDTAPAALPLSAGQGAP